MLSLVPAPKRVIIGSEGCGKTELLAALGPLAPGFCEQDAASDNVELAILSYDCTSRASFQQAEALVTTLWGRSPDATVLLVATKADLVAEKQVGTAEGMYAAQDLGYLEFFEVSAKTRVGFRQLERALAGCGAYY